MMAMAGVMRPAVAMQARPCWLSAGWDWDIAHSIIVFRRARQRSKCRRGNSHNTQHRCYRRRAHGSSKGITVSVLLGSSASRKHKRL
jgi:hypothetical protein